MKSSGLVWVIYAGIFLLVLNSATGAIKVGSLNLQSLSSQYGQDAIDRLNAIYAELLSHGLNTQQILFCLAQILHESGLFTGVANYHLMDDYNNYAGLTVTTGGYASYNSIGDFVTAYLGFLSKGADPIDASSLNDFNNRLVANHYYTANPQTYLNDLQAYYNLLSGTI